MDYSVDLTELIKFNKQSAFNNFILDKFNIRPNSSMIYGIHLKSSNKWYIGQTKDLYQRMWNTRSGDGHFQRYLLGNYFINNYGLEKFELVIIELVDKVLLDDKESYYVSIYDSYNNGFNKSVDGKGRWQSGLIYYINPNTREEIRIPKTSTPPEGFIKGNNTLGRECYYNPSTGDMIKVLNGDNIPNGYIKGNSIKGRKVYINKYTGEVRRFKCTDDIPEGFVIGNNTTNKIRVYSINLRKRYTLSKEDISKSNIDDLRYGCPSGSDWWNNDKWINNPIIKSN